jgi:hypothetical protein
MQLIRIEHSLAAGPDHLFYQPPPGSLSCLHSLIIHDFSSHTPEPDRYDHTKPKLKSFTFNKETQYKLLSPVVSHPKPNTSLHGTSLLRMLSIPHSPWSLSFQTTANRHNTTSLHCHIRSSSTTKKLSDVIP